MLSLNVNREVSTATVFFTTMNTQNLCYKNKTATFRSSWLEDEQKSKRNKMDVIDSMKHFFDDLPKSV